jgi:hypothetical protein
MLTANVLLLFLNSAQIQTNKTVEGFPRVACYYSYRFFLELRENLK